MIVLIPRKITGLNQPVSRIPLSSPWLKWMEFYVNKLTLRYRFPGSFPDPVVFIQSLSKRQKKDGPLCLHFLHLPLEAALQVQWDLLRWTVRKEMEEVQIIPKPELDFQYNQQSSYDFKARSLTKESVLFR